MEDELFSDEKCNELWEGACDGDLSAASRPAIQRVVRATAKLAIGFVADMMEAPGRHITEWDGGWNDEVAEALRSEILALADRIGER